MYNLSLSQADNISRDQLRQQIKEQVQQATQAARDAAQAARTVTVTQVPQGPPGTPMIAVNTGFRDHDMPPRVKDVSIAFFVMVAAVMIARPLMRAFGKRIERGAAPQATIPPEMQAQMQHLMQSVDAIAIEVERISEGQRFATKILSERPSSSLPQGSQQG